MGLDINEIKARLTANKQHATINAAIKHQDRIKFHTETMVSPRMWRPVTEFLTFVQNLIPDDKFRMFQTMFRYPVKTNEVTGICFDKLSRIFEGRNPAFNYQFRKTEARDDWEYYRQDVLKEPGVWKTKGWENFKTEINSVLIVDMPTEPDPGDRYPQPYFYWLSINDVINFDVDENTGNMEWIAFRQGDDKIAVIDDVSYRVFAEKDGNIGEQLIESPHNLGYCPARFFWGDSLSLRQHNIKKSPITNELESLDWYLFHYISKRNLDLYASYPIYSGYEQSCDYKAENGDVCCKGFLKNKHGLYKMDDAGALIPCPKCGKKHIAGVGSFVEIPIPDGDKQPDLRNPVQILTVDRNSLDYNVEENERLRNNIIASIVGANDGVVTKEAVNAKQIDATFQDRATVLHVIKKNFEEAQEFVDSTVCKLRYGDDFISAKINYGTDFYIFDVTELREQYKMAKDAGASESELDALQNKIIETEYRNNPTQLQRMLILAEIEPYRHLTRPEVIELYEKGIISPEDLQIKLNFANFVRRFERENINVLEFGTEIPFDEKISLITNKLKEYASENNRGRD